MSSFFISRLYDGESWLLNVRLTVNGQGKIDSLIANTQVCAEDQCLQMVIPGFVNSHSHCFQRAMAGRAEVRLNSEDSFWTWRELMYSLAESLDQAQLRDIALRFFKDCLKAGYTSICEFHYLHTLRDSKPMQTAALLIQAAQETGIRLTLLPVLYQHGGFNKPLNSRQERFYFSTQDYLDFIQALRKDFPHSSFGLAFHSLRAVTTDTMNQILAVETNGPVHIHCSEQVAEVEDCLKHTGRRPIDFLLDEVLVNSRFVLVHATHATLSEQERLLSTGAQVSLCPITEANLGDGVFALRSWLHAGGAVSIGSDSNILLSPFEELRLLEYGQRLMSKQRCVAARAGESTGESLAHAIYSSGQQASGHEAGLLRPGYFADFLELDCPLGTTWDQLIFATSDPTVIKSVFCGGVCQA